MVQRHSPTNFLIKFEKSANQRVEKASPINS